MGQLTFEWLNDMLSFKILKQSNTFPEITGMDEVKCLSQSDHCFTMALHEVKFNYQSMFESGNVKHQINVKQNKKLTQA